MATPSPKTYKTGLRTTLGSNGTPQKFDTYSIYDNPPSQRKNDRAFTFTMANSHCFSAFHDECQQRTGVYRVCTEIELVK